MGHANPDADVQAMRPSLDPENPQGGAVPEVQERAVGRAPDYEAIGRAIWRYYRGRALNAVRTAIRDGRLADPRTLACEDCGGPAAIYEHRDYSRPVDVVAACQSCNIRRGPAALPPARVTRQLDRAASAEWQTKRIRLLAEQIIAQTG